MAEAFLKASPGEVITYGAVAVPEEHLFDDLSKAEMHMANPIQPHKSSIEQRIAFMQMVNSIPAMLTWCFLVFTAGALFSGSLILVLKMAGMTVLCFFACVAVRAWTR